MAENINIEETLDKLMENRRYSSVKDILATMNPSDIASIMDNAEEERLPVMFRLLPKDMAADAFVEMDPESQEVLIRGFSDTELRQVIDELYVDDAADLVEEMPANVVKRVLAAAAPEMRRSINEILQYPEDSAGSIMTTEYVALKKNMSIGAAINRIRRTGVDKETIYTCYVLDASRELVGMCTVKDLLLAKDDEQPVSSIMVENVISVSTHDDQEEVSHMLAKYNFMALPVVDKENRMVGIVTFDDAMDVIEDEATEDIEIMAGMTPSDKTYLRSSSWDLFLHRIPWLLILMVSATFTGLIITGFENSLAQLVVLTAFIPMLMDTGGNSGSQSSVTIIRAISLEEVQPRDVLKVVGKELLTGLLCGLALSAVCFGKVILVDRLLMHNNDVTAGVAAVVCATMAVTVIIAKLIGCTMPLLAKRLGFDPAVMASPFITTCVDALSLIIYFAFAKALLF